MTKPANDNRFLAADAATVAANVAAILQAYPELQEDEELRLDTLEGETNLFEILTRLLAVEREANSMQAAIKARVADLQARAERQSKTQAAMRALMLRLLVAAGQQKVPLIEATISVTKGRESVEIVDEAALPDDVWKVRREPDKTAIKERLAVGEVPGAALKVGEPTLMVRAA